MILWQQNSARSSELCQCLVLSQFQGPVYVLWSQHCLNKTRFTHEMIPCDAGDCKYLPDSNDLSQHCTHLGMMLAAGSCWLQHSVPWSPSQLPLSVPSTDQGESGAGAPDWRQPAPSQRWPLLCPPPAAPGTVPACRLAMLIQVSCPTLPCPVTLRGSCEHHCCDQSPGCQPSTQSSRQHGAWPGGLSSPHNIQVRTAWECTSLSVKVVSTDTGFHSKFV